MLTVNITSNVGELGELADLLIKQAEEIKETINKINGFELQVKVNDSIGKIEE